MAWDSAQTTFVAFLDSDDSWHPQKLEKHFILSETHPNDDFFGHTTHVVRRADSQPELTLRGSGNVSYYTLRDFMIRNRVSTPTVMLRRNLPFRFPTAHWYAEDFGLWTSVLASGHRAVVLDLALTFLHKKSWGESGLSAQVERMHRGELEVIENLYTQRHIDVCEYLSFKNWLRLKYGRRRFMMIWRK